ncbi:hypothetical protein ACIBBB_09275 [Streptomyces sp. NPDC051217]|uniref:oxidoreductase n=1 Tax=Streptomyces sp. NPDC051217 TaxID=3365644 RepID=UPI003796A6B9
MDRAPGSGPVPGAPAVGPSGIAADGSVSGVAMTSADIDAVIAAYAGGAANAKAAGFDRIELHAAHGYLIDQFLWSHTNRRTDGYGGDLASRTRFASEIVEACRAAVPADFPVLFRISQWRMGAFDARIAQDPRELDALLAPLAAAGVDAFHRSTRRFHPPEFEGSDLNLAGWAKKLTGRPTISVGSVGLDNEFPHAFQGLRGGVTDRGPVGPHGARRVRPDRRRPGPFTGRLGDGPRTACRGLPGWAARSDWSGSTGRWAARRESRTRPSGTPTGTCWSLFRVAGHSPLPPPSRRSPAHAPPGCPAGLPRPAAPPGGSGLRLDRLGLTLRVERLEGARLALLAWADPPDVHPPEHPAAAVAPHLCAVLAGAAMLRTVLRTRTHVRTTPSRSHTRPDMSAP